MMLLVPSLSSRSRAIEGGRLFCLGTAQPYVSRLGAWGIISRHGAGHVLKFCSFFFLNLAFLMSSHIVECLI